MKSKAIFIDRDGVLNRVCVIEGKPFPPKNSDELEILPGVRRALLHLKLLGYKLICVTNQPDVARGTQQKSIVEEINRKLLRELPLLSIRVCYHDDPGGCHCRKPLPGLLIDAARDYNIDLSISFMVGDRWRDIEAGHTAGCRTILIEYGYVEEIKCNPDYRVQSLQEAANLIYD